MPEVLGTYTGHPSGSDDVAIIRFTHVMRNTINNRTPLTSAMKRRSEKLNTQNKTTKFPVYLSDIQSVRTFAQDPMTFSADSLGAHIQVEDGSVDYRKIYATARISHEVVREMTDTGSMVPGLATTLKSFSRKYSHEMERLFCTSDGSGTLFGFAGTSDSVTQLVNDYGGIAGEQIGRVLRHLNLDNAYLDVGIVGSTVTSTTGLKVTAWSDTLGSESVTFGATVQPLATSVAYFERRHTDGTTLGTTAGQVTTGDAPYGLPKLVTNWAGSGNLHGLTSTTAARWESAVLGNNGTLRALDEDLMGDAIQLSCLDEPGDGDMDSGDTRLRKAFVCNEITRELFARRMQADRQVSAPLMTEKGVKPYFGTEFTALHYDGVPFVCSPLALRNRLYLVDFSSLGLVSNGDAAGQFYTFGANNFMIPVPGTPHVEIKYWGFVNNVVFSRPGMVEIQDILSNTNF